MQFRHATMSLSLILIQAQTLEKGIARMVKEDKIKPTDAGRPERICPISI